MEPFHILFTGYSGVGKTTISKQIAIRTGRKFLSSHMVVKPVATSKGYSRIRDWYQAEGAGPILQTAESLLRLELESSDVGVVVDDVLNRKMVFALRSDRSLLVHISATFDQRRMRITSRENMEDSTGVLEHTRLDSFKEDCGIQSAIDVADVTIINNNLDESIERIIREIKSV